MFFLGQVSRAPGVTKFTVCLHFSVISLYSAKGYSVPKAFIAAQSPMSHTKGDFWELVWQFRTPTIVLLTNFMEGSQVRMSKAFYFDSFDQ